MVPNPPGSVPAIAVGAASLAAALIKGQPDAQGRKQQPPGKVGLGVLRMISPCRCLLAGWSYLSCLLSLNQELAYSIICYYDTF